MRWMPYGLGGFPPPGYPSGRDSQSSTVHLSIKNRLLV